MPRISLSTVLGPATNVRQIQEAGYTIVENALPEGLRRAVIAAIDDLWQQACLAAGSPPSFLHLTGAAYLCSEIWPLLDLIPPFECIRLLLGENVFVFHSHIDVNPPVSDHADANHWAWHIDSREFGILGAGHFVPSYKVAYWLSDASSEGMGNLCVIPGSHLTNQRPAKIHSPSPDGVPLCLRAGSAVIFDRRLWHSRSPNRSTVTRKTVFLAYTFPWVRSRDVLTPGGEPPANSKWRELLGWQNSPLDYFRGAQERLALARDRSCADV